MRNRHAAPFPMELFPAIVRGCGFETARDVEMIGRLGIRLELLRDAPPPVGFQLTSRPREILQKKEYQCLFYCILCSTSFHHGQRKFRQ